MNPIAFGVFVPIVALICGSGFAFGVAAIAIRARNKENVMLIERGATAQEIYSARKSNPWSALKNGLLLIGLAVGLILAAILDEFVDLSSVSIYFSCSLLFGGLGLIAYYLIYRHNEKRGFER